MAGFESNSIGGIVGSRDVIIERVQGHRRCRSSHDMSVIMTGFWWLIGGVLTYHFFGFAIHITSSYSMTST